MTSGHTPYTPTHISSFRAPAHTVLGHACKQSSRCLPKQKYLDEAAGCIMGLAAYVTVAFLNADRSAGQPPYANSVHRRIHSHPVHVGDSITCTSPEWQLGLQDGGVRGCWWKLQSTHILPTAGFCISQSGGLLQPPRPPTTLPHLSTLHYP